MRYHLILIILDQQNSFRQQYGKLFDFDPVLPNLLPIYNQMLHLKDLIWTNKLCQGEAYLL